jgi:hypothetical protein
MKNKINNYRYYIKVNNKKILIIIVIDTTVFKQTRVIMTDII